MQRLPAPGEAGHNTPGPPAKPVAGPMANHLGRSLSRAEIETSTYAGLCDAAGADSACAYLVPALRGKLLVNVTAAGVADELRKTLVEILPGWDWQVPPTCWIDKYWFCHACVPAPPVAAGGQPMSLEIFGCATTVHGEHFKSLPPKDQNGSILRARGHERLTVQIISATYSNVTWLGYEVPFYV